MRIRYRFFEAPKNYQERRGLSERILKRRLERNGWQVWRGGYLHATRKRNQWPNVLRKYARLIKLLREAGHDPQRLQLLCQVHHGMPDFLCYRGGAFLFVECKLGHEQLSDRQKTCIQKLHELGFTTEVHKLVFDAKAREWLKDLQTGEKEVLEKQLRLKQHW